MATRLVGADPAALDALATEVTGAASRLRLAQRVINGPLHMAPWFGQYAGVFRSKWDDQLTGSLFRSADFLDEAANELRRQAEEQRSASAAGSAAGPGGAPLSPEDQRAADLRRRYAETRAGMEDDLSSARRRLAELEEQRRSAGGLGNWIADRNPFDEGESERLDRLIAEERNRIRRLEGLLKDPARQFLKVDAGGDGRIIEVHGDLASAEHVAVHVPGMANSIDTYLGGRGHSDAHALFLKMDEVAEGSEVAVVSFLDYDAPDDIVGPAKGGDLEGVVRSGAEAAGEGLAREGARQLQSLVTDLNGSGVPSDKITVVAHSYGSTVTGIALHGGLDVDRVVVIGSPGLGGGVDDISDLGTHVPVWAGRAPLDYVSPLPAHGEDPYDSGFGAHRFSTEGSSFHSSYFQGKSLENIALLSTDRAPQ